MVPDFIRPVGAVEQKNGAGGGEAQHVLPLEELELMAADEIRFLDQVGRADRLRPEAEMRDGLGAGFVGIVDEIALRVRAPRLRR